MATSRGTGSSTGTSTGTSTLADLVEVRFVATNGLLLVAATVCHVAGAGAAVGALVLVTVLVLGSIALPPAYAAAAGGCAWAFLTGFVVNAGGQLSVAPADLLRLGALVLAGVLAATGSRRRTGATTAPDRPSSPPEQPARAPGAVVVTGPASGSAR